MTRVGTVLPEKLAQRLPESIANRRANWIEVARKEAADAARSWLLYVLCGLFMAVLLVAATRHALDPPRVEGGEATLTFGLGLDPMVWVIRWLVPLTGLVVGYMAVVGEREAGSLRVLLGLPITRREVIAGKMVGRAFVFSTMLLIGVALSGVVLWRYYVGFDLGGYAIFVGLTLFLGLLFVAMGIGFSAFFHSRSRAVGASLGTFALLVFVWPLVSLAVAALAHDESAVTDQSTSWTVFLWNANPTIGYETLVEEWVVELGLEEEIRSGGLQLSYAHEESISQLYLQPEYLLVVLALWGLVPLLVGAWRFGRSDLG